MIAADRTRTHTAVMRELADNLDRTMAGEREHVCLVGRAGEPKCACYRNVDHHGWHQCVCGARWSTT